MTRLIPRDAPHMPPHVIVVIHPVNGGHRMGFIYVIYIYVCLYDRAC